MKRPGFNGWEFSRIEQRYKWKCPLKLKQEKYKWIHSQPYRELENIRVGYSNPLGFFLFIYFWTSVLLLLFFYFTILYWFCHTSTWIRYGCTRVPNPEPPSLLPPHIIPLGHPSDQPQASCILHRTWTGISPKKTYRWLTNTWKDAQHHSLSEKCKSKPLWSTISRQPEWLRSKSLQVINAGEGVEKRDPTYTVGGNAN